MFVNIATISRPSLDKTKLIEEYGANVYPAEIARDLGYIDESNATYNQTLQLLAEKIGITDNYYQVIELDHKNWLSELFTGQFQLLSGKVTHHLSLTPEMSPELSNQYLFLYRP
jgi:hypothetical protein